MAARTYPGIRSRHARSCTGCNCRPTYEAWVFSRRDAKKIRQSFPTLAAAKTWRADALSAMNRGTLRAPAPTKLTEAAEAWLTGARDGSIRTGKRGERYKPSSLRSYERALRLRVLPALGHMKLADVRRIDVQDLADRLYADGLDPSTIHNTLDPLRAIYRRAVRREEVAVNPTADLVLASASGTRERVASFEEAGRLIAALPVEDRALWATALYAGLRRGELRALRWADVDLAGGTIRVERGWDDSEGEIEGKSRAARRRVPIAAVLRDLLAEHKLRDGVEGLVFGATPTRPFEPSTVRRRALAAWAGMEPIGLHEARHTAASYFIAAGVNAKALSTYMGHASVQITYDRYGHLFPGNEDEAAALLDAYFERSDTAARIAQLG